MLAFQRFAPPHPRTYNTREIIIPQDQRKKPLFSSVTHSSDRNRTYTNQRFVPNSSSSSSFRFGFTEAKSAIHLPEGLKPELMPKHVSLTVDGHRRWARDRNLSLEHGYTCLVKSVKQLAMTCSKLGIQVLTVVVSSTETWNRPKEQVDVLMSAFEQMIIDFQVLIRGDYNMKISVIGDKSRLPQPLQSMISSIQESSKTNEGMCLMVAMSYGGKCDITEASKKIAEKVRDGVLRVEDINEALFAQHLETSIVKFPNPDLHIRVGGELRISNSMLWQLAYTELYFSSKFFPDFDEADLVEAIRAFQKRERRYGADKVKKEHI